MSFCFIHPDLGRYEFSHLDEDSFLDSFQTGPDADSLGKWLREKARVVHREDLARVWLMCPGGMTEPVGYFTLANHELICSSLGLRSKNLSYESTGGHKTIVGSYERHPAQLLGKFALEESVRGRAGMSSILLAGVFSAYLESAKYSASRYLVLHARNTKLVQYYKSLDFDVAPQDGVNGLRTCYMSTQTIKEAYSRLPQF